MIFLLMEWQYLNFKETGKAVERNVSPLFFIHFSEKRTEGVRMEKGQGIFLLLGVCVMVLMIAGWQKRAAILKNFLLRLVLGTAVILAVNYGLREAGIHLAVGLNLFSLLSAGTLGLPGVAMLYGIAWCGVL